MFWADRIAGEIEVFHKKDGPIVIRDEKTMSGYAHIGSMLSAAMHGILSEALSDAGAKNIYYFEFNDMDAFDGIPVYLEGKGLEPHLGKSLKDVPSPYGEGSYAQYFAQDFKEVIEGAGFAPIFDFSSEWYLSGKMDGIIREALENADSIRRIMKEVSGADRKPGWLPILSKCPACGKIATTEATDFDGETVQVNCYETRVEYTKGCGFAGRVSPFGGNSKLYWKTEWPAKWKVRGVEVEGAGKDHGTKGGSHDVASHISQEVFNYPTPFFIPHEFFLVGGKKISSSKGLGSTARSIFELLPLKMFRLSLIGKDIMQQRNFDPEGDSIPVLYDQYDKLAESHWAGAKDDYARLFEMLHPDKKFPPHKPLPRFSQVAFIVQMPHLDMYKEFPEADRAELDERAKYARHWLDAYAPEKFVFKLQESLPDVAKNLPDSSKQALKALHDLVASQDLMPAGEELHAELHKTKEFKAIYLAFLGKESGPKAGWFLSVLPRDFVLKRLQEASA
jgi:lysyl-tRNA synthetase class 1